LDGQAADTKLHLRRIRQRENVPLGGATPGKIIDFLLFRKLYTGVSKIHTQRCVIERTVILENVLLGETNLKELSASVFLKLDTAVSKKLSAS
jgi:hypothetical protein